MALNCWLTKRAMVVGFGEMLIEVAAAEVTERDAAEETDPRAAVIVAFPAATARAKPLVGVLLLMAAIVGSDELQDTVDVML